MTAWFNGQVQFTLSRTYNDTAGINAFPANDYDLSGEWARADVDRRHRFVMVGRVTGVKIVDLGVALTFNGATLSPRLAVALRRTAAIRPSRCSIWKTLAVLKQTKVGPGLDGIMYDEPDDKVILTNHSRPIGTLTALDPRTGDIVATVELEDTAPEGAAADGKGHIFVNNESTNTIQVITSRRGRRPPRGRSLHAKDPRVSPTTRSRTGSSPDAARRRSWLMRARAKSSRRSPTAPPSTRWAGIPRKS